MADQKGYLKVMAGREMYRAGRSWPQGVSYAKASEFTQAQLASFNGDPNFSVEIIDSIPGAEVSQAATNVADTNMKIAEMEKVEEIDAFLKETGESRKGVLDFADKRKKELAG